MTEPRDPQEAVLEAVRPLRRRLDELERRRHRSVDDLRFAIVGTALAAALSVLTVVTWAVDDGDPYTLWGLVPGGWQALVMLALVAGTAVATPLMFLTDNPARGAHLVMVWVCLLTAVWVIVLNAVVPDDADTAPGRWITMLVAATLAAVHGFRAEELRTAH